MTSDKSGNSNDPQNAEQNRGLGKDQGPHRSGAGTDSGNDQGTVGPWRVSRRVMTRFVAVFALLMIPFAFVFFELITQTDLFESYLNLNADLSAAILRWFGEDARSSGLSIASTRAIVQIRHGCDAIFPSALFVAAVLASPVRLRLKWPGVLIGTAFLLTVNLVRIITLYYTRIHWPDWFHSMHVSIWQPAFIFLALLLWVLWALWAVRGGPVRRS